MSITCLCVMELMLLLSLDWRVLRHSSSQEQTLALSCCKHSCKTSPISWYVYEGRVSTAARTRLSTSLLPYSVWSARIKVARACEVDG